MHKIIKWFQKMIRGHVKPLLNIQVKHAECQQLTNHVISR